MNDIHEWFVNTDGSPCYVVKKTCIKCSVELPLSEFSFRGGENYLRTECKKCTKKLSKVTSRLKTLHKYPPKDYTCPICKESAEVVKHYGGKKLRPWVLDHDHVTDTFRGWLCHKCNRGLGAFNNIHILKNVLEYLTISV
jgi:hypothetical protein